MKQSDESKKTDISLVLFVASHGSIRSIDHLSELIQRYGEGSTLSKLKLHRTKASKLILNVIAPALLKELIEDIGDGPYSLLVDESTDVSTTKFMAYGIRYFSEREKKIITDFLGFTRVHEATAEKLHISFKAFIAENGLDLKRMVGIGTDGAANMCGKHNSLFTRLQGDVPNLMLMKCMAHSVSLCASKAADQLPSEVESLIKNSKSYFAHSSLRLEKWEALFRSMNDGKPPLRLVALSATRWLAFYNAVSVILKQWTELKEFFNLAATIFDKKNTEVRVLADAYRKDTVHLYLVFVEGILNEVMAVNLAYQRANADAAALYDDLRLLVLSLARRIFKPSYLKPLITENNPSNRMLHNADVAAVRRALDKSEDLFSNSLLPLESVDYGHHFLERSERTGLETKELTVIKQRARGYLLQLVKELADRLPQNVDVIERMRGFSPQLCLSPAPSTPVRDLPWDLAGIPIQTIFKYIK